jgi:hypothetical protein
MVPWARDNIKIIYTLGIKQRTLGKLKDSRKESD